MTEKDALYRQTIIERVNKREVPNTLGSLTKRLKDFCEEGVKSQNDFNELNEIIKSGDVQKLVKSLVNPEKAAYHSSAEASGYTNVLSGNTRMQELRRHSSSKEFRQVVENNLPFLQDVTAELEQSEEVQNFQQFLDKIQQYKSSSEFIKSALPSLEIKYDFATLSAQWTRPQETYAQRFARLSPEKVLPFPQMENIEKLTKAIGGTMGTMFSIDAQEIQEIYEHRHELRQRLVEQYSVLEREYNSQLNGIIRYNLDIKSMSTGKLPTLDEAFDKFERAREDYQREVFKVINVNIAKIAMCIADSLCQNNIQFSFEEFSGLAPLIERHREIPTKIPETVSDKTGSAFSLSSLPEKGMTLSQEYVQGFQHLALDVLQTLEKPNARVKEGEGANVSVAITDENVGLFQKRVTLRDYQGHVRAFVNKSIDDFEKHLFHNNENAAAIDNMVCELKSADPENLLSRLRGREVLSKPGIALTHIETEDAYRNLLNIKDILVYDE